MKRKMALELTFLVMNSHCVPFPDAGAPDIIILRGSNFVDATIYNTHTRTLKRETIPYNTDIMQSTLINGNPILTHP